mmetsp:Transcript_48134/g.153600  ORF Transcript_48134/g.153600 Transcript_48134/m.153600 type:complete len:239 (-) Transcript_48134:684-1400(-)
MHAARFEPSPPADRTHDGGHVPRLPLLHAAAHAPRPALDRDGRGRHAAAQPRAPEVRQVPGLPRLGASPGVPARRQRPGEARGGCAGGAALRLRRGEPQRGLPILPRGPEGGVRLLADAAQGSGAGHRARHEPRSTDPRHGEVPAWGGRQRFPGVHEAICADSSAGRLQALHRACAEGLAVRAFASSESQHPTLALHARPRPLSGVSGPEFQPEWWRGGHRAGTRAAGFPGPAASRRV